jgi:hypothetical protein
LHERYWQEWKSFFDPRKKEYLFAPFGYGVYQLFNENTKEYVLFGRGKNLAYRITTMLPKPLGQGTRRNNEKKDYVLEQLEYIQYRTIPLDNEKECRDFEKKLKALKIHKFNENRE